MTRGVMSGLLHELRLMAVALQFLTRVPVPARVGFEPGWLHACVRHFPLVGCLVGGVAAAAFWMAASVWPLPVAVLISMATTLWLTGGFHEDGWADTLDALGGAVSRDRALTIMKDSRIGAYGAMGLALMLMLKAAVLWSLAGHGLAPVMMAMLWAHAASRAAPVLLMRLLAYAGDAEHAKAKPLATQVTWASAGVAWIWLAVISGVMLLAASHMDLSSSMKVWPRGLAWALLGLTGVMLACGRWFERRLGGYTGDTLGATQQCTELAALLGFLSAWPAMA